MVCGGQWCRDNDSRGQHMKMDHLPYAMSEIESFLLPPNCETDQRLREGRLHLLQDRLKFMLSKGVLPADYPLVESLVMATEAALISLKRYPLR